MRWLTLSCLLAFLCDSLCAQYVYTIKADSVKITNCDSAELILENHTQNVPGFLFNTGNGRTVFKRVLQKINDSIFLIGPDTLDIPVKLVGANGLNISNDTVQLGGSMLNTATITTANNRIWFKTPFKSAEDSTRTGQVFFGDSDYIQFWKNAPPNNLDGQYNSAVVISKTKENNNENVDLLSLTTADAPGRNGWRFFDYTNVSGLVCPRLETYSQAGATDFAFEHDVLGKAVPGGVMYMLNFQDYDSANLASKFSPTTGDFFAIANNYKIGFYVDNNFDLGIGKKPAAGTRLDVAGTANISGTANVGGGFQAAGNFITLPTGAGVQLTTAADAGFVTAYDNSAQQFLPLILRGNQIGFHTYGNIFGNGDWYIGPNSTFTDQNYVDSGYRLDVNGTARISGAVRLTGITQDSTVTSVIVSDNYGNLHFRSASSLAADNLARSSLTINGPVKAKKLLLSPGAWADYVFDSSYQLPELAEVESYIRREHHLPGIPSAAAVQKDSLDVGAGQAALLKKIEELTLYTIDQNKRIHTLEDEVEVLKKMVIEDQKEKAIGKK